MTGLKVKDGAIWGDLDKDRYNLRGYRETEEAKEKERYLRAYNVPNIPPSEMADNSWEALSKELSARSKQVGGDHYSKYKFQPFDIADEYDLSRRLTVGLRYILRNKGGVDKKIDDLKKAKHCIELEIERLENESGA